MVKNGNIILKEYSVLFSRPIHGLVAHLSPHDNAATGDGQPGEPHNFETVQVGA